MSEELILFDYFADDLLLLDLHLVKGQLDFLIFQEIFNSLDLDTLNPLNIESNCSLAK